MMPTFSMDDFLLTLNIGTIGLAVVVGLGMGFAMNRAIRGSYSTAGYLYWQLASGFVFFVPLAILRGLEGSDTWSRLIGTGVLWGIFVLAKYLGAGAGRRWWG